MHRKVYELSSYNEIIDDFEKLNFKEKYQLINYLIIVGNKEEAFKILKKVYAEKISKREIVQLDFLQLIYHVNNNDKYNRDAIKYKLMKENDKFKKYYSLICEEDFEKKIKIFEDIVNTNNIKKYFRKKEYRNNIIYTYLMNYAFLDDPITIKYIEEYINNSINKLNKKKSLTIYEINYVEHISNFIFGNLSYIYIKNNEYFINFIEYKKLIEKVIAERKRYTDYSKNKNIEFNTIMYWAIRTMTNLEIFRNEEKKMMVEYLDYFVKEHIDEISDDLKKTKDILKGDFWSEIEKLLIKNNEEISLLDLIMNNACFENEKLPEIFEKLKQLIIKYKDKVSKNIVSELKLGKEIINLWLNGKFDRSELENTTYKISDYSNLVIKFFNGEISPENFIFELNNIKKIDCFEILNWHMLEDKCKIFNDFGWLAMILERMNREFDQKANIYFEEFYTDILKSKRTVFLKDFIIINNIVIKKFDNYYFFIMNSVNILVQCYKDYKDAEILIDQIVSNWEKINLKEKEQYFIYILIVIVEQQLCNIEYKKIKQILDNSDIIINKSFILLYLKIIYKNIKISLQEYKEILVFIIETYKKQDSINDNLYRIIASLAIKYEENKEIVKLPKYDVIYYKNDKHYHKYSTDELLNEGFKLLRIEELPIKEKLKYAKEEHLLMFFICRIFFSKIEEKGMGKKILLPADASAKEIITELNKCLGIDKKLGKRNLIRNGQNVNIPWLNIYEYNSLFEDIVSSKWKIFNNSSNTRLLSTNKIIHLSSLILLAKINRLDVLEENNCFVSVSIYDETIKRKERKIVELGKNILEEAVFYDKELDELAASLEKLYKADKIYTVSEAMILPKAGLNKFDDEIIKKIFQETNNGFCIITEDPFWLKTVPFSNMAESVISLLIDSIKCGIITSNEFLDSIKELDKMNYNMNIGKVLYAYLLTKSDDSSIKEAISIINNYKLK